MLMKRFSLLRYSLPGGAGWAFCPPSVFCPKGSSLATARECPVGYACPRGSAPPSEFTESFDSQNLTASLVSTLTPPGATLTFAGSLYALGLTREHGFEVPRSALFASDGLPVFHWPAVASYSVTLGHVFEVTARVEWDGGVLPASSFALALGQAEFWDRGDALAKVVLHRASNGSAGLADLQVGPERELIELAALSSDNWMTVVARRCAGPWAGGGWSHACLIATCPLTRAPPTAMHSVTYRFC